MPSNAIAETPLLLGRDSKSIVCQAGKVFAPDPTDPIGWIILVFSKPKLALFADHVEDLRSKLVIILMHVEEATYLASLIG